MPELAKFDPVAIAEGLKDKIRAEVAGLIPDDTIKAMIIHTTSEFINGRRGGYNSEPVFDGNTLKGIIQQLVKERIITVAREELDKPEWSHQFDNAGRQVAGDALRRCVVENADAMLASMMASIAANAALQVRYQLEQALRNT